MELNPKETKRKRNVKILWWVSGILAFILFFQNPFIAFLIIFSAIWLHPRKDEIMFKNRLKDFKHYKARIVFSALAFFVALMNIMASVGAEKIKNYPQPTIEILSSQEHLGNATDYTVRVKADNATEVIVSGKNMAKEDGADNIFYLNVPLEQPTNVLRITAKNEYKEDTTTLKLTRDKTDADIAKEKEEEEARLAKEQAQIEEYKARIQRELDSFNKPFDNSNYRGTVDAVQIEIALFGAWAKLINEAKGHSDPSVVNVGKQLENKVSQLQVREFPLMRKAYADILNKNLWEQDIEVRALGNANSTIEFVGGLFAANKNIKDAYLLVADVLKLLRFDRANYKWFEYDNDYTYFTIESSKDSEIVELK